MATGSTVNVAVNVTAPGLSKANTESQQLHSSLKGAATAAAAIRVATPVRAAQASMPGATDTNLSRGVAGVSGAAGRDFAKQAQGLGGLVHVYATFAANLFAVSAAFGALSRAADTTNLIKGLDQLGASSGRSLGTLAKQMVTVTDGALSLRDAMTSTALATAGGMSSTAILRMTEVAKKASQALGRDMTDSMDRLTKGIVKIQPELLDELGIMARVIPSQEAYARQLGKSVSALTDFEKKQAFANAVLEEGERKFNSIKLDVNPYSKIAASMTNIAQIALELVNKGLTPILNILSASPTALAIAMAGLATILLKQALPAIGMFRENSKRMADENSARLKRQVTEQQDAAIRSDAIIEASARKEFLIKTTTQDKIANIQKMQFSKSVLGTEVRGLLSVSPFELTSEQVKKIESQHASLFDKISKGTASKAESDQYTKLNNRLAAVKKINDAAKQAGADAQEQVEASDKRWYAHQELKTQQLRKMRQEESRSAVLSNAADNAAIMGPSFAFSKLREETAKLDAGKVSKFFTVVQGGASIATAAIGNLLGVYGMYAALAVATFGIINYFFSTNAKQAETLSKSHDALADSLDTVDRVIKNLAANKDPLDYIGTAAAEATANALRTVAESLKQVTIDTKAATDSMSLYDKAIDNIKSTFGQGIGDQAAKDLAGSISKAFKLVATGRIREEAAKQIKDLLKIDVDPSSIDALKTAINASNVTELAPKLQAITDKMSHDISNIASAAKSLNDSFATATKSYDTIVSSLMPADNIAKLGFDLVKAGLDFDKALEDPKLAISEIARTSKDISRLKLLDPAYAQDLLKSSVVINDMASSYANITKEIDAAVVKQAELSALIEETQKQREQDRFVGIDSGFEEIEKAKAEIATLGKKISIKVDAKFELEAKLDPFVKKFTEQQYSVMAKGADYVRASIGEGFEKASITVSKALSEAQSGTIGGIKESAALDKQALASQRRAIEVNNSLILATANLTKVQEDILIEELKTKAEKATGPEKTRLESQIVIREQSKIIDYSKSTLDQLIKILGSGTSTEAQKQAAKRDLPTIQALEANRAKGAEISAGVKAIDIKAEYAIMDARAVSNKDIEATKIAQLATEKAILDIQAKGAPYINEQLLVAQILNEQAAIELKSKQDTIDYNNKIAKLELDRTETVKRGRSVANIDSSLAEVRATRLRALAKEEAAASIKATGDRERRTKLIKDEVDFAQKLLDIQIAVFNINRNKDLTIAEDTLSLAKEQSSLSAEYIIKQTSSIALAKEQQRILEVTIANLSAQNNEISDFDKKTLDINDKTSKSYKDALAFHTANLNKLKSTIDAEKAISNNKQKNIELDRTRNIELGKQLELEAQLLVTNTLRQNQTEIALASKSLDEQRLNNAKELNRLDEISYINSKGLIETARQKLEYDDKSILATQALARAQNDLRIANIAAAAFDSIGEGAVNTNTAGQVAAQDAIKIAQSNIDKNTALYEILKQQTAEQKAHNLELQKQKDFLDNITGFTKNLTDLFGEMGTNIGSAAEAMAKLAKNTEDRKKAMDLAKPEEQEALQEKQTKAAITDITLIASANKKMFGEKTAGYKILEGIEKAGSIMTAALRAKELAATISSTAKLITESIPGIYATAMKQLGPIFGPIAATAAIAAFVGSAISGGGNTVDMTGMTAGERQTAQGTGTITGDSTANSESIKNSLDILSATSVEGLSYSNRMVDLLKSINDGIGGVAKGVYGVVGLTGGSAFGTNEGSSGFNILGGLFGKTSTKEITDSGLAIKGTFADFVKGSSGFVSAYEDVLTTSTSSLLWFSSTSQNLERQITGLDPKVSKAISKVFINAADAFIEAGSSLGMTAESVMAELANIDLTKLISLRGLKGKELEDALAATFSSMLDTAAGVVFKQLDEFNKFGEGMLQTAVRVIDGLDKVNLAMQSLNKATVGSGITGIRISEFLIDTAGGLDKFIDKTKNFNTKFLSEAERLAPIQSALNKEFARLGVNGTVTRKSFKDLILGFKITDKASAKTYNELLDLSDSVDQLSNAAEDAAKKIEDAAKTLSDAKLDQKIKIYGLLGKEEEALKLTREKELDALDALLRPGQRYINALEDEKSLRDRLTTAYTAEKNAINSTINSLKSSIKTLKDYKTALTVGASSTLTPAERYAQARKSLLDVAAAAKTVVTATSTAEEIAARDQAVSQLSSSSDTFLASSKEMFASSDQYTQDFASVLDILDSTSGSLLNQETMAEKQLTALEQSVTALNLIKVSTDTTATLLAAYAIAQAASKTAKQTYETSNITAVTAGFSGNSQAFASGGLASGLSLVGEQGPEVIDFRTPTRVYSNRASNDLLSNQDLVVEIRSLHKEIAQLRMEQRQHTGNLIAANYDANNRNADAIVEGNQKSLVYENWRARNTVKVA